MSSNTKNLAIMTAVAIGAAGAFFLLREHWWHALRFAPYSIYLLFLACPLLHLFMHHDHGGHGGRQHGGSSHSSPDQSSAGSASR
jgi:hypothetical protein